LQATRHKIKNWGLSESASNIEGIEQEIFQELSIDQSSIIHAGGSMPYSSNKECKACISPTDDSAGRKTAGPLTSGHSSHQQRFSAASAISQGYWLLRNTLLMIIAARKEEAERLCDKLKLRWDCC